MPDTSEASGERGEYGERGERGGHGYRRKSWLSEIFD